MSLFDLDKATASQERFERYFVSALKKRCNSLKRTSLTKRRKREKFTIPFSIKEHDIPDSRIVPVIDNLGILDVVQYCRQRLHDKGIISLRMDHCSAVEICQELGITPQEYRSIMKRIRRHSAIQRVIVK